MERICGSLSESWPVTSRQRRTKPDANTLPCLAMWRHTAGLWSVRSPDGVRLFPSRPHVLDEDQRRNLALKSLKFDTLWFYFDMKLSVPVASTLPQQPVHPIMVSGTIEAGRGPRVVGTRTSTC